MRRVGERWIVWVGGIGNGPKCKGLGRWKRLQIGGFIVVVVVVVLVLFVVEIAPGVVIAKVAWYIALLGCISGRVCSFLST